MQTTLYMTTTRNLKTGLLSQMMGTLATLTPLTCVMILIFFTCSFQDKKETLLEKGLKKITQNFKCGVPECGRVIFVFEAKYKCYRYESTRSCEFLSNLVGASQSFVWSIL